MLSELLARALAALLRLQSDVTAVVLAACAGLVLSALLRALLGPWLLPPRLRRSDEPAWRLLLRAMAHLVFAAVVAVCGGLYAIFVLDRVSWGPSTVLAAALTFGVFLAWLVIRRLTGWAGLRGVTGALLQVVMLLGLAVLALSTLMSAGFLALTEDRPVLLVELTGVVRSDPVQWAPPGEAMRTEVLQSHEVVFHRPADGAVVGKAWVYGDEVAIKGRVLRLSPLLNAAGIPNLFELTFAFNGYRTAERHNTMPHQASPLSPLGPLAVHPLWRGTQERLLRMWEQGTAEGSRWVVRSVTTESTFFPLADPEGRPLTRSYRLVLTPGGLTAS